MGELFDFGQALELLKKGYFVTRRGWNGKKMFLWLKPAAVIKSEWCRDEKLKSIVEENGGEMEALGTICMKTSDNKILTGWVASQSDLLGEDWTVYDKELEDFLSENDCPTFEDIESLTDRGEEKVDCLFDYIQEQIRRASLLPEEEAKDALKKLREKLNIPSLEPNLRDAAEAMFAKYEKTDA